MEVAALAGLLAVGYALMKTPEEKSEGFDTSEEVRTPPGEETIPGKPRQVRPMPDGDLDLFYQLPSKSKPSASLTPQAPPKSVTSQVQMNMGGQEQMPVYNSGKSFVSPLSGMTISSSDFTHNNMVPFFRGSVKQNMNESSNSQILDSHIGTGFHDIGKREQAPLFDPHREPTGNIYGTESSTDFMQERMIMPKNRAGERPVEPEIVGPGIGQGYSSFPEGGFQQFEIGEIMKGRKSVDELRASSNPKLTYEGRTVPGKSLALQRGDIGETRKYRPDTFHLNENGERNFPSVGENAAPTARPAEVIKFQTREETSSEFTGPAAATDFKATYTVPSFRAPMVRQHDGFGYRNADSSMYGVPNTDAKHNDFGRAGYDLPTNQRNVTSERGQALNLTTAGVPSAMQVYDPADLPRSTVRQTTGANDYVGGARSEVQKLTVYDPNDVARTTFREFIGVNDYVGIAGPGSAAQKLTVYDPTDITRTTGRNTMMEPDRAMNVTRAGMPGSSTLQYPDGFRSTNKESLSAESEYTGSAGSANAKGEQVYDYAYAMRSNPVKETVAAGRKPTAGNGSLPLFNGEDYINMQYRKIDSDSLNDRANTVDRVVGMPSGMEAIGLMRPKNVLKLDVAHDRNVHDILDTLSSNPYAIPVHRVASTGGSFIM